MNNLIFNNRWMLAALTVAFLGCGQGPPPAPPAVPAGSGARTQDPAVSPQGAASGKAPVEEPSEDIEAKIITGGLSNPTSAGYMRGGLFKRRIPMAGHVLERSPDDADMPFLILEGAQKGDQQLKVHCQFSPDAREAVNKVAPGDQVLVEGIIRKDLSAEGVLNFEECKLLPPREKGKDGP